MDAFSSRGPAPCSGRGVGDYVLVEQAGAWTTSSLPICVGAVCLHECARMHRRRAWDARIKKRLVEIKALPWSLLARLQATRMTNPSLHTLQCPPCGAGPLKLVLQPCPLAGENQYCCLLSFESSSTSKHYHHLQDGVQALTGCLD